jgi:hypothetical protein
VESHGTPSHFTQNEANCVACQARSLQAAPPTSEPQAIAEELAAISRPSATVLVVSADQSPQTNPRAPPTLS